jgi:hypothetical protein
MQLPRFILVAATKSAKTTERRVVCVKLETLAEAFF